MLWLASDMALRQGLAGTSARLWSQDALDSRDESEEATCHRQLSGSVSC